MALINDVSRSIAHGIKGVATGVWAAVATPLVHTPLRTLTKQVLKGGLLAAQGAQSLLRGTREEWNDMVREARAELQSSGPPPTLTAKSTQSSEGEQADAFPVPESDRDAAAEASDLTVVRGIGGDYEQLLRAGGIRTVRELAAADPEALRNSLRSANEQHDIVGRVPSVGRLQGWIERADEEVDHSHGSGSDFPSHSSS